LQTNSWVSETVIKVPNKKVEGWALPEMPGQIRSSLVFLRSLYLGRRATYYQRSSQRVELGDDTNNGKVATKRKTYANEATVCAD